MTQTISGRNVRVEVALTLASLLEITTLTKAYPPVAGKTAHGLLNGAVGYVRAVTGMTEADEQAFLVANKTNDAFDMPGLDFSSYSTWAAAATNGVVMGATWGLIEESSAYAVGGGAADPQDDSRLHMSKRSNRAGMNAAEDLRISVRPPEIESAALAFCMRAARNNTKCLFKISTTSGQMLRVAYGTPSVYDESLDVGGLATGGFSIIVPQFVLKPNV